MATKAGALTPPAPAVEQHERETTFDIFRRWGYLQASLDPLGQFLPPEPFPTSAPEGEAAAEARGFYCGTIAVEFMHIASPEQRPQRIDRSRHHLATNPDDPVEVDQEPVEFVRQRHWSAGY